MKNITYATLLAITSISCKAQNPVISISSLIQDSTVPGAYYKDIENVFTPFIGEWQLANETKFFKVKFLKKTQVFDDFNNFYEDIIVGEYIYKENGVIKVNSLSLLSSNSMDPYDHNISGNIVLHKNSIPPCEGCQVNEKRLSLVFGDPEREILGLSGAIELRRVDENGVQKLKMTLRETGNIILEDGMIPEFTSFNLPWGTYILTRP